MKIIAVSGGSPNGNNDSLAKEALMGAREYGADIEFIRLNDLNLKPCNGCRACVTSLIKGGAGNCVIKDDFSWFDEKVLDADGVIFVMPIFQKGAPAVFKILHDRMFGPSHDLGINTVGKRTAKEKGKAGPDERKFKKKAVSFISLGGSDWTTRVSCDLNLATMAQLWTVIDDLVYSWSRFILADDEKVQRCHQVGVNMVEAVKDINKASYKSDPGVCPQCQSRNFYIHKDGRAECEVCGIIGNLVYSGDKVTGFTFPEAMMERAHNTIEGKLNHMDDIYYYETTPFKDEDKEKYENRVQLYKEFIQTSRPERK